MHYFIFVCIMNPSLSAEDSRQKNELKCTICETRAINSDGDREIQSVQKSTHRQKKVRFSNVSIRTYDLVCIGLVNKGPGIGLDWFYSNEKCMRIEIHEFVRNRRFPERQLIMSATERKKLLVEGHGYKIEDLRRSCASIYYRGHQIHPKSRKSATSPRISESQTDASSQVSNPMTQGLVSISQGKNFVNAINILSRITL
jgi:hypothetical protein